MLAACLAWHTRAEVVVEATGDCMNGQLNVYYNIANRDHHHGYWKIGFLLCADTVYCCDMVTEGLLFAVCTR